MALRVRLSTPTLHPPGTYPQITWPFGASAYRGSLSLSDKFPKGGGRPKAPPKKHEKKNNSMAGSEPLINFRNIASFWPKHIQILPFSFTPTTVYPERGKKNSARKGHLHENPFYTRHFGSCPSTCTVCQNTAQKRTQHLW